MAAHQAAPSLGFSRQEHCSGLPFPSPINEFSGLLNTQQIPLTLNIIFGINLNGLPKHTVKCKSVVLGNSRVKQ